MRLPRSLRIAPQPGIRHGNCSLTNKCVFSWAVRLPFAANAASQVMQTWMNFPSCRRMCAWLDVDMSERWSVCLVGQEDLGRADSHPCCSTGRRDIRNGCTTVAMLGLDRCLSSRSRDTWARRSRQASQATLTYGLSPVCLRMWTFIRLGWANTCSHPSHVHGCFRSFLCKGLRLRSVLACCGLIEGAVSHRTWDEHERSVPMSTEDIGT